MIKIQLQGLRLLGHEQPESLDMLHIHGSPLGGIFHSRQRNNEIIPPVLKGERLIETITKLIVVLFMMVVVDAAVENKPGRLRIIDTAAQRLITAPIMGEIKKGDPRVFCCGQLHPHRFMAVPDPFAFFLQLLGIDPPVALKGCFEIRKDRELPCGQVFIKQGPAQRPNSHGQQNQHPSPHSISPAPVAKKRRPNEKGEGCQAAQLIPEHITHIGGAVAANHLQQFQQKAEKKNKGKDGKEKQKRRICDLFLFQAIMQPEGEEQEKENMPEIPGGLKRPRRMIPRTPPKKEGCTEKQDRSQKYRRREES